MAKKPPKAPSKPGKRATQKAIAKKAPLPRAKSAGQPIKITGQGKVDEASSELVPGKKSNRKTDAKLDPKSGEKTVAGMKAAAEADKKKHGVLEQAATPKKPAAEKPPAKPDESEAKAKTIAAMREKIPTMKPLTETDCRQLGAFAADYYETTLKIEKQKPVVLGLRGLVAQDTEEIMKISKEAESLAPDKETVVKRLGSVGKDLRRREREYEEEKKKLLGLRDQRAADVEHVMKILSDALLGQRLPFPDGDQKADEPSDATPAESKSEAPKPDAPAPSATTPIALEVGATYRYVAIGGKADGKQADVKVVKVKGARVWIEVVNDPSGATPTGHKADFDSASGTWTRVESSSTPAEGETAPAPLPATLPPPPGPTHVKAPAPSWHRRTLEEVLGESIRPAAMHALQTAGLNTVGDVVAFELETNKDDGLPKMLTDIRGILANDATEIRKAIAAVEAEHAKQLADLTDQRSPDDAPKPAETIGEKIEERRKLAIAK